MRSLLRSSIFNWCQAPAHRHSRWRRRQNPGSFCCSLWIKPLPLWDFPGPCQYQRCWRPSPTWCAPCLHRACVPSSNGGHGGLPGAVHSPRNSAEALQILQETKTSRYGWKENYIWYMLILKLRMWYDSLTNDWKLRIYPLLRKESCNHNKLMWEVISEFLLVETIRQIPTNGVWMGDSFGRF